MFEEGDTAHGITFLLAFKIMTYMYLYHYRFRARHRVGTEDNSEIFFLSFHKNISETFLLRYHNLLHILWKIISKLSYYPFLSRAMYFYFHR